MGMSEITIVSQFGVLDCFLTTVVAMVLLNVPADNPQPARGLAVNTEDED